MIPVLYKFVFNGAFAQILLYLFALGLVAYVARSGWLGALGPDKNGKPTEPTKADRQQRAIVFGVIGAVLAGAGLYYALPKGAFLGSKGEGIPIHSYGVLLATGFISAVTVAGHLARKEWPGAEGEKKREQIFDMAFYVLISALVGSRVLFIIVNWKDYAAQPSKIFDLGGGLVFYGGLIGATLTCIWWARKNKIDFYRLADVAIPTVSLGQAFGRLGCFGAGCCWGDIAPAGTSWAVHFPGAMSHNLFGQVTGTPSLAYSSMATDNRFVVESTGQVVHDFVPGAIRMGEWVAQHGHTFGVYPTQLMESVGQLGIFVGALLLRRYRRFHGMVFAFWLMAYAILRSTVELFRGDVERGTLNGLLNYLGMPSLAQKVPLEAWYNISISQFISICMFAIALSIIARRGKHLFRPSPGAPAPAAA